jgi:hypothetical protein
VVRGPWYPEPAVVTTRAPRWWSVGALSLALGCAWELPRPSTAAVGGDGATDTVTPPDEGPLPDTALPPPDTRAPDTASPPPPPDTGAPPVDTTTPDTRVVDTGAVDTAVVDSALGEMPVGGCTPGMRRACWSGTATARGRGACRDGVQTCTPGGTFGIPCEGELLPDCRDRECGSDDCGGQCGMGTCPAGQVCDDSGRCIVRACGMSTFTITCADGTRCPTNSSCLPPGLCVCSPGFVGVDCTGRACGTMCSFPNWGCALSLFCGGGTVLCPTGTQCPRHSTCDAMGRCVCAPGFVSVTCAGSRCESCPGTAYRCIPAS